LIARFELKDDFTVLEVGPRPEYFSLKAAAVLARGTKETKGETNYDA
jgi:hypothetical protein